MRRGRGNVGNTARYNPIKAIFRSAY
jgi:hypothetical protein